MKLVVYPLTRHWGRTLLAVLQTALAVGAVVAILATGLPVLLGSGRSGAPVFEVRYGIEGGPGEPPRVMVAAFTLSDLAHLTRESDAIESAAVYQPEFLTLIQYEGQPYAVRGAARVSPEFAELAGVEVVEGSFFGPADLEPGSPKVAMVSQPLARMLFGSEPAVGREIVLRPQAEAMALMGFGNAEPTPPGAGAAAGTPLRVIGVFKPLTGEFATLDVPLLLPVQAMGPPPGMLPPASAAQGSGARPGAGAAQEARFLSIFVKAKPGREQEAAEALRLLLEPRLEQRAAAQPVLPAPPGQGGEPHLIVGRPFDSSQLRNMLGAQISILTAVGLLAAVVSGIAILTVSLVTVAEQARAIALRRALGASRRRVMGEMLLQSVVLGAAGGLGGVAAAWPLGKLLGPLLPSAAVVRMAGVDAARAGAGVAGSPWLLASLVGLLLAVAIGVVAGLYPAWDASRTAPVEAWRESAP